MRRRRLLMVAYHYPPGCGGSGVHRSLAFSRYLPEHGWDPVVLTVERRAHREIAEDLVKLIPPGTPVKRAFALDAARHLSIAGRYPFFLSIPDPWSTWWPAGVAGGLELVRRYRPDAIWSTYPIATAHLIGASLRAITGLPWIADLRDPMTVEGWPYERWKRWAYRTVERLAVRSAARIVFTAPGALREYRERYPQVAPERWVTIPNGYDEETVAWAERAPSAGRRPEGPVTLVHSGVLYPSERDPRPFYAAIAAMLAAGEAAPGSLRVLLRATAHDAYHRRLIDDAGVGSIVELGRTLPYRDALREMVDADGLLVFQASNCNIQIPAKLYEYLRARRPILALTDPEGDTAATMRAHGLDTIARIDDRDDIRRALRDFVARIRSGDAPLPDERSVSGSSRRALTRQLAGLLDDVSAGDRARAPAPAFAGGR